MRWSRFLLVGIAGVMVYLAVPSGPPRIAVYAVVAGISILTFGFAGAHRHAANRTSWAFLLIGLVGWATGDAISGMYLASDRVVPTVSPADAAYLVGHLAFVVGILAIRDGIRRVLRLEDILEALIVATGLGLSAWMFVVGTKADTSLDLDAFSRYWPAVVYVAADGFVVTLLLIVLLSRRARTLPFVLTTLAFVTFALSGWALYAIAGGLAFRGATVVSAGWLVGYVLLTSAALYPPQKLWMANDGESGAPRIVDRTRLIGLSAAILMSPVVMAVQLVRDVPVSAWGWVVTGTSILVVCLVAARIACFLSVLRTQSDELMVTAVSDPVTGLANRRHLGELLDRSVAAAGADGVVVFVVDIDRFAQINETFGYSVGDRVLHEIGQRLVAAAVSDSVVGRLGGDQFVVSMVNCRMLVTPIECAEHFRLAVSRTMFVRDINVALDATVGVVDSSKLPEVDSDSLLQRAHVALTAAKRGHAHTSVYSPSMDSDRHDQMRLLGELETALRERQLRVFFQPCLDLKTGRISGAEALLRWQHPREGLMAPFAFLPDAERTGLLPAITAYVLEDSLRCCSDMRAVYPNFRVSVNLSVRDLLDPALAEQVATALQRHGVPSSALEFEVTETTAMTDPRRSVDSLVALRDLGVSVAIDDYGTGYSSLAYLRALPVQTLKIDKSFVTAMNSQPTNASIVGSTIDLARSLGMTVVAEGVEDSKTLDRLRGLGCDGAQGFHLGRPVPAVDLGPLVEGIERRMAPAVRTADVPASESDPVGSVGHRN